METEILFEDLMDNKGKTTPNLRLVAGIINSIFRFFFLSIFFIKYLNEKLNFFWEG